MANCGGVVPEIPAVAHITPHSVGGNRRATVQSVDCTETTLGVYVRVDLFPKRKFILTEAELDYSHDPESIARQCLRFCNMEGPNERGWWDRWKKTVKDGLTTKRNHCQNYCKDEFMGKFARGKLLSYHQHHMRTHDQHQWLVSMGEGSYRECGGGKEPRL